VTVVYCANGHPLGPGEQFCPTCGAAAGSAQPPPPVQPPAPYTAPAPPGASNTWVWVVSTAVVAAAAVAIVFMITSGGGDDGTTGAQASVPPTAQTPAAVSSSTTSSTPSSDTSETTSTSTTSTAPIPVTSTTTTVPGPVTVSNASWELVTGGDLAGAGGQGVFDLVATADGYLAVDGDTAIWTSPDAISWTAQPVADLVGTQILHIEYAPDGTLVGVGHDVTGPKVFAAWTSPDGLTWTMQAPASGDLPAGIQQVNELAAYPGGYVAGGYVVNNGDVDVAWWTSPDGVTWTAGTIAESATQQILGIAISDDVMIAVGEAWPNTGVWRGRAGESFTPVDHENLTIAVSDFDPANADARVFAWDVTAGGPGFVAVGCDQTTAGISMAAVWTSVNGRQWRRFGNETEATPGMAYADFAGQAPWTVMDTVVESNGTLIVVGRTGAAVHSDLAIWESTDGSTWYRGAVGNLPEPQRSYNAIAQNGELIVVGATGALVQTDDSDGAVWVATPDPDAPEGGVWSEVSPFEPVSFSRAFDVMVSGDRALAVGYADADGAFWESVHGTDWSRLPAAATPAGQSVSLYSIVSIGETYFAAGSTSSEPAIWWSTDRSTWSKATVPATPPGTTFAYIAGIEKNRGQLVAYGKASSTDVTPLIWVSSDGRTWTDTGAGQPLGSLELGGVTAFEGQIVFSGIDWAFSETPKFWTSTNGQDWTPIPDDPAFDGFSPKVATAFEDRLVIAGRVDVGGTSTAAVLVTTDLQSWDLVVLDGTSAPTRGFVSGISVVGPQLFVSGRSGDGRPTVWSTGDLMFWTRSELPSDLAGLASGVARISNQLVVVGSADRADDTPYATAWTRNMP